MCYIVNTNPLDRPGLWTYDFVCEITDTELGLALRNVLEDPTLTRLVRSTSLEVRDAECSVRVVAITPFFLIDRSRGKSMNKFLNRFDKHDYVKNDHKVRSPLKKLTETERSGIGSSL